MSDFRSATAREAYVEVYDRVLAALWPVPPCPADVVTSLGTVRLYRHGPDGDDPFVLLSGAGGNALAWYRHVAELGVDRPVVAVDPLGECGRSVQTAPIVDGADAGRWLAEVLAAIGAERAHLVGSSFGGWTALQQVLHHPGRVGAVTLVDPAGFAPLGGRFYRWLVLGGMAGLLPAGLRRRAARRLDNSTLLETELLRLGLAGRRFRRRLPSLVPFTDAELAAVGVPVQLLLGERSALHDSAAVAQRVAGVAPGWRREVVPGTGHALVLDDVALCTRRVREFSPTRR
ncbi:alpha/beta fold hydrolase [Modestobacter sp. I12A-02628]|uniref:Alpha/beta fold hydrolase n=1 Tax=Goekera deserti TaxID=2497753 RepID=A0A7K3WIF0_9ACTN|nr:alpha/beta fold hydrolase [Goekera deserti]NDI47039.1 alpha/beta fold hydrolase [Goekera deserti]NEL56275.1 alpha/beta fold hydrolase [Goekera deserti]